MSKRRGRGEGGVYQRKDGRWEASVSLGFDANGKRQRVSVYGETKREALEKRAEKLADLGGGEIQPSNFTVSTFLEHWLGTKTLKPYTKRSYRRLIAKVKAHPIGRIKLLDCKPSQVQGLYTQIAKAGAKREPSLMHELLRAAFNQAVTWRYLRLAPTDAVEPPKRAQRTPEVLTREQMATFLDLARPHRLYALLVVASLEGIREGELFALRWRDVSLDKARIQIRQTLAEIDGRHEVVDPKTQRSRRAVDISKASVEALREHRKRMLREGHSAAPVFCDTEGGYLRLSNVARRFVKPTLEKVELGLATRVRFHDLRHGIATYLLEDDVHPSKVAAKLGHASVQTTLKTYSHVLSPQLRDVADRSDQILANGRQLAVKKGEAEEA